MALAATMIYSLKANNESYLIFKLSLWQMAKIFPFLFYLLFLKVKSKFAILRLKHIKKHHSLQTEANELVPLRDSDRRAAEGESMSDTQREWV